MSNRKLMRGLGYQTIISDGFSYSDGPVPSPYQVQAGTWAIVSGQLQGETMGYNGRVLVGDPSWDNYAVEATVTPLAILSGSSINAMLIGRYRDTGTFYQASIDSYYTRIAKSVGGGWSNVKSYAKRHALGTPYRIRLEMDGTTLRLYEDGVLVLEATDIDIPSGIAGFQVNMTRAAFDDFLLESGTAAPPPTTGNLYVHCYDRNNAEVATTVQVGGVNYNAPTVFPIPLAPGNYTVYMPLWDQTKTAIITAGQDTTVTFNEAVTPPPATTGSIEIHAFEDSHEVAAAVAVDGAGLTQTTPVTVTDLNPSDYVVAVTYRGVTKTQTIAVIEGAMSRADFQFVEGPPVPKMSIKGMMFTSWGTNAYSEPNTTTSLNQLKAQVNPNWIGIPVVWTMPNKTSTEIRASSSTVSTSRLVETIQKIHQMGFKIKLHLLCDPEDRTWRAQIAPSSWPDWFNSYRNFVNTYAEIAQQQGVEMLCLGAELSSSVSYENEWREIIRQARQVYTGSLTYGANHDSSYAVGQKEWERIKWWDALDYAGIDGYFQLTNVTNPTLNQLIAAWQKYRDEIQTWQATHGKHVVMEEIGYESEDGGNISIIYHSGIYDPQEQIDCIESFFRVFSNIPWFAGVFWWGWSYDPSSGGSGDLSIMLNNKPAAQTLGSWFAVTPVPSIIPILVVLGVSFGALGAGALYLATK